jgi:lipopolysaccharide export system protein LptA
VKYEGKSGAGLPGVAASPGSDAGNTRVTFLWARNGVDITAGADRRVTSDLADFDVAADTALFAGNVHVTQDKNVLTGGKLFVDRKGGRSRLDDDTPGGGRIAAMFYQGQA